MQADTLDHAQQYLLTIHSKNKDFLADLITFAHGFNEHYHVAERIELHEVHPPIDQRYTAMGLVKVLESKPDAEEAKD